MLIILVKTVIIGLLVFFVIRLMGKRQIGEMQPFELVITLILAEVACLPMNDPSLPLYAGIVPIVTLTFLHVLLTFISQKSLLFRKVFDGRSVIVIDRGTVVYQNLRKMCMNMNDLIEAARSGGYPDLSKIEYAIFETNGMLSVIEKASGGGPEEPLFPMSLIVDGKRVKKNFETAGLTDMQVTMLLKKSGFKHDNDVLYLDVRQNGETYLSPKSGAAVYGKLKPGGEW